MVRTNHRAVFVLLFALLAMAATPPAPQGYADPAPSAALAPDTPVTHHDLRDWLPRAARHVLSTPAPDSWWAVHTQPAGTPAPSARSLAATLTGTAVAVALAVAPSTRAPPARVS